MATPRYPDVDPQPDLPALEHAVLSAGREGRSRRRSNGPRRRERQSHEYVFTTVRRSQTAYAYGTPPTGSSGKTVGYQTRRGDVSSAASDGLSGMTAEVEAAQLVIAGHPAITASASTGSRRLRRVAAVHQRVERYVTRQEPLGDFENDYKTIDPDTWRSVMWAFKTCGRRSTRGLPRTRICWRLRDTTQHTDADGRVYRTAGPALTVCSSSRVANAAGGTETPGTLPSTLRCRRADSTTR